MQVQIEKPVLNNEMYELGHWGWVPQTVGGSIPPCLERVACDDVIGFWSEFSC